MLCKNPFIRAPDPKDPKKYKLIKAKGAANLGKEVFPCGQCLNCRINKARNWTGRLLLEALDHGKACFATLTYSEDNLPPGGTLVPKHVTDFFKRLRYQLEYQDQKAADACLVPLFRRVRYYYCGEYGERGGRPHYHLAIFGICQTEGDLVTKCWTLGHCYIGELNKNSMRYIAGYIMKGMTHDKSEYNQKYLQGRHPEFQRMSRIPAIGKNAIMRIAKKSNAPERFRQIKQGPSSIFLSRVLQQAVDSVCGFDNDGSDFNDYCIGLLNSVPVEDRHSSRYRDRLVRDNEYKRTQQRKRHAIRNRRSTL